MKGAVRRVHEFLLEVDPGDLRNPETDARGPAKDGPHRIGYVARIEEGAGHLVQERGEEVVVIAVDEQDVYRLAGKLFRTLQSAKTGTDNYDSRHAYQSNRGKEKREKR